jgi:acetolactate synthase-1/3 small subunit
MTIGISGQPEGLHQIIMQVNKLIDVMHCTEHTDRDAVAKELVLIKVAANPAQRTEVLQIIEHYNGKTVDLQDDSLIALIAGNTDKLDAAVRLLSKFDIVETVRTGKVVMARGLETT